MIEGREYLVEWERPVYGVVRVLYRWERGPFGYGLVNRVVALEWDLFTPEEECSRLTRLMEVARVDRYLSVSA